MPEKLQQQIALKVLPPLPAELRGWSVESGGFSLTLEGVSPSGLLRARMSTFDAHDGMHVVLPVDDPKGGGFDVVCVIAERFFRSGVDATVELAVNRVERRKPYRSERRAKLNELCLVKLLSHLAPRAEFEAKLIDVSAQGVGLSSERPLQRGDRLELASHLEGHSLRCSVVVLYSTPMPFGRHRSGCRIVSAQSSGHEVIERYVDRHGRDQGRPQDRRISSSSARTGRAS
ncbi:MAG: PilZ domain-containing protein [Gaiellales bacterium]